MSSTRTTLLLLASAIAALAAGLPDPAAAVLGTACTTGAPMTTAGYPMSFYVRATPSAGSREEGYQPKPEWASQHLVGTYTFGVPEPIETGFAFAQYKCQYYCRDQSKGGSFFVRADPKVGSYCDCYNDLMGPQSFVSNGQGRVGAWNAICET
ncbi:hypothetical protein F5Y14DRAFT_448183 [Nemania sp. NC0429]|nr:hypothetical protein F5Y14DRAFT_448183 [Nemania sp. NC0429]